MLGIKDNNSNMISVSTIKTPALNCVLQAFLLHSAQEGQKCIAH